MPYLVDEPLTATSHTLLFAHGAGAAMDHPWMTRVARGLAAHGIRVVRFEFPYMAARRTSGKRGAPDRQPVLLETFRRIIEEAGGGARVAIGGKSMGGRMASMIADELGVRALVCFGYPFHPPGQPEKLRTAHLAELRTRTLILQGTRDPFGTEKEVCAYRLSPAIRVEWLPEGGHSLEGKGNLERAIALAAAFVTG
ncbi:MAG TPA: alpha/beta family hydrolase [Thermoanaerobaculia bacterium]|nr:alpha/beta family hydrolase [Thermoanaerobaculia bacterium]